MMCGLFLAWSRILGVRATTRFLNSIAGLILIANGEMVIALLDEDRVTLKKFFREPDGRVRLQPANATMQPIFIDHGALRIQGVVIGVLRKY